MSRERALNQIVSLKRLSEDQTTTEGERQAARDTIAKLREKYGIPDVLERAQREANDWARRKAEAAEAYRRQQEHVRDHDGLTAREREWARRDPIGFAASRDTRTRAEKNQDMNESWGHRDAWHQERQAKSNQDHQKRCPQPETFFDRGGNPRKRNTHVINCDRCNARLQPGEGTIFQVGGNWVGRCCEMRPGPRRKRF